MNGRIDSSAPAVGIWKSSWLPYTETFIRDQIASLPEWDVIKIGFTNLSDGIERADYAPYNSTSVDSVRRSILGVRPYMLNYLRILRESRAELLHAHFGPGGLEALPLSLKAELPLITTFHGADATRSNSSFPWLKHRYPNNLRRLFEHSERLIAVSSYVADLLKRSGAPQRKIEVLHTGTRSTPLLNAAERQGIVFVGRLIGIKGPMDMLRAVNQLPKELRHSTPITLVGEGPMRSALESYASDNGLRAKFLGRLDSSDIPGILRSHSVFCGPSLPSSAGTREGFGMVFVEAALQELPCAGYASGGVNEAVLHGVTGLLGPEANIGVLSRNLMTLLKDSEQAQAMGREGRLRALREFCIEGQAAKLARLYQDVAS